MKFIASLDGSNYYPMSKVTRIYGSGCLILFGVDGHKVDIIHREFKNPSETLQALELLMAIINGGIRQ